MDLGRGSETHDVPYQQISNENPRVADSLRVFQREEVLCEVECEHLMLLVNEEPWSYEEAKELKVWRNACRDEIESIVKNNTWSLVDLPLNCKAIGLK